MQSYFTAAQSVKSSGLQSDLVETSKSDLIKNPTLPSRVNLNTKLFVLKDSCVTRKFKEINCKRMEAFKVQFKVDIDDQLVKNLTEYDAETIQELKRNQASQAL